MYFYNYFGLPLSVSFLRCSAFNHVTDLTHTHITIKGINEPAGRGNRYLPDKEDPVWMESF